jgi:hypothetical protein
MPMDSKCAITMPLLEQALQPTGVTPTIEVSSAARERALFARARAKADAARVPPPSSAEHEPLSHPRSKLVDSSDVTPVVLGRAQEVELEYSGVRGVVPPELT